jgi:hypothetical protein
MPEAISSLPPATAPIRHPSEVEGAPDTHEMSFNELWQNKKEGISFSDVLDIANPLQHIPVVSTVSRNSSAQWKNATHGNVRKISVGCRRNGCFNTTFAN